MFNYYNSFDYIPIGLKVRKQLGKKYIYQIRNGTQVRYDYVVPDNPRTELQQANRWRIRQAVLSWQSLNDDQKQSYRKLEPFKKPMSGYNYYIQQYIKVL